MRTSYPVIACVLLLMGETARAADSLEARLSTAKSGQTIELPAGEFRGGVTIPPGVSLKGAGVGKTVIDAQGILNGLTVGGGSGTQITDLTIRNAQGAGVVVKNAAGVTVSRVRATGGACGFSFQQAGKGRIENCISDGNGFGISVSASPEFAVLNCTVVNCSEMGISLAASPGSAAFNNCVVGSAICLNIDRPAGLLVDHNLYFGMFLAQMQEQSAKRLMSAWTFLTGLDAHSVQMPVEFKDAEGGDFTPLTVLSWALDRAATAEWGVAELGGVKAPATDMRGQRRAGRPDVGAVETVLQAPRVADGQFRVASDAGLKSAGVFTKDGTLVAYLFQGLPLPKGRYSFWLPVRDYVGQPIPAGDYEVRLAESDFRWKYLHHVGDNGEDRIMGHTASFNPRFVAYAPNGTLVMQEGPSEDATGVRGYDSLTGKLRWRMASTPLPQGIAIGRDGTVYVLGVRNPQTGESRLTRLDSTTGKVIPWPGAKGGHVYPATSPTSYGLAILQDRLYLADADGNKLFVIGTADGKVVKALDVPAPACVAGDEKNHHLWIISHASLMALNPDGTKVAEAKPVPDPVALAVRDGQLAVASGKTGKVYFFDANDPQNLKPLREVGRADGPYGAFATDRFFFQRPAGWQPPEEPMAARHALELGEAALALGADGRLAVAESFRLGAFDGAGRNLWHTIGIFGNRCSPSFSTQNQRLWEPHSGLSFRMNEKDGTWTTEALWDRSAVLVGRQADRNIQFLGDFADGGKTFGVFISPTPGLPFGPAAGTPDHPVLLVTRLDGYKLVPVLSVTSENNQWIRREDTNGDGIVTKDDAGMPLGPDAAGQPLPPNLFNRFNDLQADGSITTMGAMPFLWKRTGLNAKGVPVYDGKNYTGLIEKNWRQALSPYDFQPDYGGGFAVAGLLSDGGCVLQATLRGSGGTGLNNGAGTDLVGYSKDGRLRWIHQLAQHKGIAGMGTVDDITLTSVFYSGETLTVDADGLSLGGYCEPQQLHYAGYWIDHPNLRLFKMPDGKLYAMNGDNSSGRYPWYRLDNQESLKRTRQPFHLAEARAKELAALDWQPAPAVGRPPQPQIRIPKLAQPMAIDGDLEKWRRAGVQPQIVIGPNGGFNGPGDNSAIIRMAYEGQNLYFQVLQFDDVPVFYQMVQENCVELAINGAVEGGMQFVVWKNAEGQDIVWRNRFFAYQQVPQREFTPEHAPRIIQVLDDARAVTEREPLEALYGVDLASAKVVLSEFMIPMDKETWSGAEADVPTLGPGKSFWIGFFVDDNDTPYTDVQRLINWPATFGVFNPKEDGALATCE